MHVLGIALEGGKVRAAGLQRSKQNLEIKLFAEGERLDLAEGAKLVSGLDCQDLILRKVSLKLKSRTAIRKVLPFQAEAALPYAAEEIIPLPFTKKSGKELFDVTLFASTKSLLCTHLEKLQAIAIDPDQVSCAPAALTRFALHFFPEEKELLFLHVGKERSFCGLIAGGSLEQIYTFNLGADDLEETETMPLPWQKELDRAFAFLRKKTLIMPNKLLLTGMSAGSQLKEHLETTFSFGVLEPSTPEFALPIGLALEGLMRDGHSLEFRQGELISQKRKKRREKLSILFLSSCLILTAATWLCSHLLLNKKEHALKEQLLKLPQTKTLASHTIDEALNLYEESLAKEKTPFPFVLTAPCVSDLLAWISTHPRLGDEIDVKEVRYKLTKYPKVNAIEPYVAKVDLKFTAATPAAARQFREALAREGDLVNSKQPIGWNVQQNVYEASFQLKRKSP